MSSQERPNFSEVEQNTIENVVPQQQSLPIIDLNTSPLDYPICEGDPQVDRSTNLLDLNINMPVLPDLNCSPNCQSNDNCFYCPIDLNAATVASNDSQIGQGIADYDNEGHEATISQVIQQRKRTNVHDNLRRAIYEMLLKESKNGILERGSIAKVASDFGITLNSVSRIWKQGQVEGKSEHVLRRKKGKCGRKPINIDFNSLRDVDLSDRTSIRRTTASMNLSPKVVFRALKKGTLRRHTNATKPPLSEDNKLARLRFCLSMLDDNSMPQSPVFKSMYNVVHIDEKWFYMTKKSETYYLLGNENDPVRTCRNKNYIPKVMFLVAQARPRFNTNGDEIFSGKIGVFPLITMEAAKRSSANRQAGTMEMKPIPSITKAIYRSFLIDKVLPAIRMKWPTEDSNKLIYIQHDNARTHIDSHDSEFCLASKEDGFDIRILFQPPNSPDLNVLDLGFFSAIQALQDKTGVKTIEGLVQAVINAYESYSSIKSNYIFLSLQYCMKEIMKVKGGNNYKLQHLNKEGLERKGLLPIAVSCDPALVTASLSHLNSAVGHS